MLPKFFYFKQWRRGWDLNPRWRKPHTISSRAESAALAPLHDQLKSTIILGVPLSSVTGHCATMRREPGQGRKAAALSGLDRVPQNYLVTDERGTVIA